MASFKGYDREDGQKRRQGQRKPRRNGIPRIEFLEKRQLLSASNDTLPTPLWTPTDPTNLLDAQNGPMANLGVGTVDVYKAYVEQRRQHVAARRRVSRRSSSRTGWSGSKSRAWEVTSSQFVTELTDVGMQITTTSAYYGLVDGYAPINELPTIAELPQTMSGQVAVQADHVRRNYQGIAYNEAETSMFADVARTEFDVDGTGVTIGVLSDSVNQFTRHRRCALHRLGRIVRDRRSQPERSRRRDPGRPATTATDEGRAMLENIHDVAPGASLAFATADDQRTGFRQQHRGPSEGRLEYRSGRRRLLRRADVPGRLHRAGHQYCRRRRE